MLPLPGKLTTDVRPADERGTARRTLRLEVQTSSYGNASPALIRDLSVRGLLIETTADLAVGETIQVNLPEAGPSSARIVWTEASLFGCEFMNPVSQAAVSAALLLAPAEKLQQVKPLPELPTHGPFGDRQDQGEPGSDIESRTIGLLLMVSLTLLLLSLAIFIFALLALPVPGMKFGVRPWG